MTKTIAIAGKGGTGKTTISALLTLYLAEKGVVLAIDGDPSSNLNLALGLPLRATVGDVREEMAATMQAGKFSPGVSQPDYLEMKIQSSLTESEKIDLLAMGRPEGPGCYCAANNFLRASMDRLGKNYDFVVVDNEAGMEHISRQTTREVNILLIISDPTIRGVLTAARVKDLIHEMRAHVGRIALVVNRVQNGLPAPVEKAIADSSLELVGLVPTDANITELDATGTPLTQLPAESPLRQEVWQIAGKLGL